MMKGVTLLGVEHLQHFSICDVSLVSNDGKVSFETKAQECVLKEEDTEDEGEGTGPHNQTSRDEERDPPVEDLLQGTMLHRE